MRPDGSFPPLQQQHSWHSPVPYLFGGLAAMFGLIAFALLVLACSYWKLSGYFDDNGRQGEQDPEGGDKPLESIKVGPRELDEKIVVIMAGDQKPTFIATPTSSKNSSFKGPEEEEVKTPVADSSGEKPGDEHRQELHGGKRLRNEYVGVSLVGKTLVILVGKTTRQYGRPISSRFICHERQQLQRCSTNDRAFEKMKKGIGIVNVAKGWCVT